MGQKEYEDRLASQGGVCLLCCKISRRFVVDHDHATGAVRGILCTPCNSVLGQLEAGKPIKTRSSEWVKKAKEYLRATATRPKSNRNVE